MRHPGTKRGKPKRVHGYRWYDWQSGAVDLLLLAEDAASGLPIEVPNSVPAWLAEFPTNLANATTSQLARLDADARRACVEAMSQDP